MKILKQIPQKNQEKSQTKQKYLLFPWVEHVSTAIKKYKETKDECYLKVAAKLLPKKVSRVLVTLIKMIHTYQNPNPSEKFLALQAGSSCESYMSNVVCGLQASGIIVIDGNDWTPDYVNEEGEIESEGRWLTNNYKLTSLFFSHEARLAFARFLPHCQALVYQLLMQVEKRLLEQKPILLRPYSAKNNINSSKTDLRTGEFPKKGKARQDYNCIHPPKLSNNDSNTTKLKFKSEIRSLSEIVAGFVPDDSRFGRSLRIMPQNYSISYKQQSPNVASQPDNNNRPSLKFKPLFKNESKMYIPKQFSSDERKKLMDNEFAREFPYPRWNEKEVMLVDWFKDYVSKRTITKSIYNILLREIEKGPRGPKAITGELQTSLNQAHFLVNGYYLTIDQRESQLEI